MSCGVAKNKLKTPTKQVRQKTEIKEKKKNAVGKNETCEESKHQEEKITN